MARGVPPPKEVGFQPGKSGNPAGRPPMGTDELIIKGLSREALVKMADLVLTGNLADIQRIPKQKDAPVLLMMLASVCVRIIEKGDMSAFQELLNRLIGKVKEEVKHTGTINTNAKVVVSLPDNGRSVMNRSKAG